MKRADPSEGMASITKEKRLLPEPTRVRADIRNECLRELSSPITKSVPMSCRGVSKKGFEPELATL